MWFGWSISIWQTIFFWVTSAAAVLGGFGLVAAFFSAIIGYKISDVVTHDADVRIGEARAVAATATEGAAKANERAAEAEARAAEAQLALEKFKAPRGLTSKQQLTIIEAIKAFAGQEFSGQVAASVQDARPLWVMLDKTLRAGNWIRVPPWGATTGDPPAGIAVSPDEGVTIFAPADEVANLAPAVNALTSEGSSRCPRLINM
jgi:HAMP domain-containing protein